MSDLPKHAEDGPVYLDGPVPAKSLDKPKNPCDCLCHNPTAPGPCTFYIKHKCSELQKEEL